METDPRLYLLHLRLYSTRYFPGIYVSPGEFTFLGFFLRLFRSNGYFLNKINKQSLQFLSSHQNPLVFCRSRDVILGVLGLECSTPFHTHKTFLHIHRLSYDTRGVRYSLCRCGSDQNLLSALNVIYPGRCFSQM